MLPPFRSRTLRAEEERRDSPFGVSALNSRTIPERVPFAAPLRAVDDISVTTTNAGLALTAWKHVDPDDPYLSGHFPGFTIFPGVFAIESLRQAAAFALGERDGVLPDLVAVRSVRFLAPLLAGDTMTLEAVVSRVDEAASFAVEAACRRSDGTVSCRLSVEMRYGGPPGA